MISLKMIPINVLDAQHPYDDLWSYIQIDVVVIRIERIER